MSDLPQRALVVRAAALYMPLAAVALLAWWRRPSRRDVAAALLATAWTLPALLAVNKLGPVVGWWRVDASAGGAAIARMPVELWIGWALLWGTVPALTPAVRSSRGVAATVAALIVLDVASMPALEPVVVLGDSWLVGEAVACAIALLPALALAAWTALNTRLAVRSALQIGAFSGLIFFVIPEVVFAASDASGWSVLLARPRWQFVVAGLVALPFVALGLQAVREFAVVGGGTPLPLDPPSRLVTTGPYAYVANPMQLAGTVLLVGWGGFIGSPPVVAAGVMAAVFSAGLAAWNEHRDLERRFARAWTDYRAVVRLWWPRWRPASVSSAAPTATLDVAATCDPCREVGAFFLAREPVGLVRRDAEDSAVPPRRITYTHEAVVEAGVGALGRALEHCNLGWATLGWILRLPALQWLAQLIADAVGAGPRDVRRTEPA